MLNRSNEIIVQSLGRKQLQLTSQRASMCCFYYVQQRTKKKRQSHTILLMDKSASILCYLEELKTLISATLNSLKISLLNEISILLFGEEKELEWLMFKESASNSLSRLEDLHKQLEQHCGDETSVLSSALEAVFEKIIQENRVEVGTQLILMTDGHLYSKANGLSVEQSRCYGWMLDFAKQHVMVHIIGIGDYHLDFLTQLAKTTNTGDFYPYQDVRRYQKALKQWLRLVKHKANEEITILNENYFLSSQTEHFDHPKRWITLGTVSQLIVTFDDVLKLEENIFPTISDQVSETIEQQFRLAYAYYLLKQKQVDEAAFLLQGTELWPVVTQGYSNDEISRSLAAIYHQSKPRFTPKCSQPSVFKLLQMILDDPISQLWWPSEQCASIKQDDGMITFIAHPNLHFKVAHIRVSSTKQNVTVTVKVEGVARQRQTGLNLDCYVFRDYFLIENGNLKFQTLTCQLSPILRQRLLEMKVISSFDRQNHFGMDVIDLAALKLVEFQTFSPDRSQEMAKELYELERLKVRIQVLKTLLAKQNRAMISTKGKIDESVQLIRNNYHVSDSGLFLPRIKQPTLPKWDVVYQLVTEWRIENFPKQQNWQQVYDEIQQKLLTSDENPVLLLYDWLNQTKKQRLNLQNKIYLLRMQSQLCQQSIFDWDEVLEKQNQVTGKRIISKQKIGEIVVCENKYFIHSAT